jgi:hypothetical protein
VVAAAAASSTTSAAPAPYHDDHEQQDKHIVYQHQIDSISTNSTVTLLVKQITVFTEGCLGAE